MRYEPRWPEQQDQPLIAAAKDGWVSEIESLLDQGADIEANADGTPLVWAAYYGQVEAVSLLIARGADLKATDSGNRTAWDFARARNHPEIEKMLRAAEKSQEREKLLPDQVVFERQAGSCLLEEVYDFKACERISILRADVTGAPVSFLRESFSKIEDEASLRKAFNEHARHGGQADEAEIFPAKIKKGPALR
jgi:ankyrin repeat protein